MPRWKNACQKMVKDVGNGMKIDVDAVYYVLVYVGIPWIPAVAQVETM